MGKNLYGTWPNEIALIGEHLLVVEITGNFFLYCIDYMWMVHMTSVEILYFGTTSFDADGIPMSLRFMTNLCKLKPHHVSR